MGDGGFWHNGLITGVASNLFNKGDGVLIVMQNGYASATGQQYIPSSAMSRTGSAPGMDIERMSGNGRPLAAQGAHLQRQRDGTTLKEAMKTAERGLKVIIADGERQLAAAAHPCRRCRKADTRRTRNACALWR